MSRPVDQASSCEVSVVIPCLNEAETIGICVRKAVEALARHGIDGEVVVADNGSTDDSRSIAAAGGARIVEVAERGYGSALMGGIEASRGRFVIMGDADDSYDFSELHRFIKRLREGFDLVQGCRLPAGGGTVAAGAMPPLHRWLGNPAFSWMARHMFSAPINDIYCGYRGFTRALYDDLRLRCTGMEFATEMIIKASLYGRSIAEVPITLHPDGRVQGRPHLRTFRDGWRTLRFFLLFSPRWLFLAPGIGMMMLGTIGYALALPGVQIAGLAFDAHTLVFSSLALLLGYQSILLAVMAKAFAVSEGLHPPHARLESGMRLVTLERGLIVGAVLLIAGLALMSWVVKQWVDVDFGALDYARVMRFAVPGSTLAALGFETIVSGFMLSLLRMRRR